MASSSLTPYMQGFKTASPVLVFTCPPHPTAWDPVVTDYENITGRISCEQQIVYLLFWVEYPVPPDGKGEKELFPGLAAELTLRDEPIGVLVSANNDGQPSWKLHLKWCVPHTVQSPKPADLNRHVRFELDVPVGSKFFEDTRNFRVTRWFRLKYKVISGHDHLRREDCGEETFSITSVGAGRQTEDFDIVSLQSF